MRKKIIHQTIEDTSPTGENWLDLERLAQVEMTSESGAHPIESALTPGTGPGWQAAQPGPQTIRLIFDQPQRLKRICLKFREEEQVRTQEFVLRWLPAGEASFRELLRQQYHFSPPGTTREVEDYGVELNEVKALELRDETKEKLKKGRAAMVVSLSWTWPQDSWHICDTILPPSPLKM